MDKQTCVNNLMLIKAKSLGELKIFEVIGRNSINTLAYLINSLKSNNLIEYIKSPLKIAEDFNRKPSITDNLFVKTVEANFFQGIWITDKNNPKLIIMGLENFLAQARKLTGYEVIIFTNISPKKLIEQNPILELEGVAVKNIAAIDIEHKQLLDLVVSPEKYIKVDGNIKNSSYFGVLIDLAKYLVAESQGGIIADFNFNFAEGFKQVNIASNDFIGIFDNYFRLENGFFSTTKPHHVIFEELLNIMDQMLNNDCVLDTLEDYSLSGTGKTELFSMLPLSMAYMKYNNLKGNIDSLIGSNCEQYNNSQDYSAELLAKNIKHEALSDKLYSSEFNDFVPFYQSYNDMIHELAPHFGFNCIEVSTIGYDNNKSMSWHSEF